MDSVFYLQNISRQEKQMYFELTDSMGYIGTYPFPSMFSKSQHVLKQTKSRV